MASTEPKIAEGPLQFGWRRPGLDYSDRPCAYGVAARDDGSIALVKVTRPEASWWDLPGGALDPGEHETQALVREFGEETGLKVGPGRLLARANQYMVKTDGRPANNLSALFEVQVVGSDPALKIEPDHELQWLNAVEALKRLRHDSHAWAVAAWMRANG